MIEVVLQNAFHTKDITKLKKKYFHIYFLLSLSICISLLFRVSISKKYTSKQVKKMLRKSDK